MYLDLDQLSPISINLQALETALEISFFAYRAKELAYHGINHLLVKQLTRGSEPPEAEPLGDVNSKPQRSPSHVKGVPCRENKHPCDQLALRCYNSVLANLNHGRRVMRLHSIHEGTMDFTAQIGSWGHGY